MVNTSIADFGVTISGQFQVNEPLNQLVPVMGATPWHTQGNQIISPENKPFRITGVNWFGLETDTYAPHGLQSRSYQSMMDQMKELGYNTIRLPFSNQLFEEESIPNGINFDLNPDLQELSGLEILDQIVGYAGEIGLHIILDRHRPSADDQSALWYTDDYSQKDWIKDWKDLAARYSNDPTIIGADLHNEPHGSATWGSGDVATDWRLAAEKAGNAILKTNPNWLIFVEGIQYYEGDNYWWGGNLKGVEDYPVTLNIPDRLVYSAHDYPKSVGDEDYPLPWFQEPDYPNNLPGVWDSYWGYIHKENIAPVLMGEFGSKYDEADADPQDRQWLEQMVNYLGEGSDGINWTYWAWNPEDENTGGILQDDWLTINVDKQNLLSQIIFVEEITGNSGNNRLDGSGGNDRLNGKAGNDRLNGKNGDDVLIGGMGKDVLIGGKGQDSFSFNSPKEGVDTIKKFIPKDDTILVSAKGFKRGLVAGTVIPSEQFVLGSTATDSDDRFLYDKATGELFFDSDGSGVKQPVLFAVLTNKPTLTNADIFVGV